jgi:hypothetical protein
MKATATKIEKRITTVPDKSAGIIAYDLDNSYPQRVLDIINASGTGTLCTKIFGKFIYGQGFVNDVLSKTVVNRKRLTANKLLFKSGKSVSKFNGFAVHVNYNANYNKTSFNYIPFQDVRFTTDDNKNHPEMIAVYDDWQKVKRAKIDEKQVDYFNYYNPDPIQIQKEVDAAGGWENYNGQIMYWSVDGVEYPLAPSDSVLEDIQTDSKAKNFKLRNITTNFMASYLMRVQTFEDDEQRQEFIDSLIGFQGADDTSKIMVVEQEGEETPFELEKVDIQDIGDLYAFTEESVRNNIIRASLIPSALVLAEEGIFGGSDGKMISANAYYNGVTLDYRLEVSSAFEELFNDSVFIVGEDFDIKETPPSIPKAKDTAEGKAKIFEVISNASLSESKKSIILQRLFDFDKEDADLLAQEDKPDLNVK